jgi:predicted YcjX-like family ATPase
MFSRVRSSLWDTARGLSAFAEQSLNQTVIRVAVTGLSRAGKTVFLTSLITNLLALGKGRDTLPRLRAALTASGTNRLRRVRIARDDAISVPRFDFARKLSDLAAGVPSWPAPSEEIALIALELEIDRVNPFTQRLGRRRIRLELLDYPGEWLLDLPLLSQSYRSWSEHTLAEIAKPPRASAFAGFLDFVARLDPNGTANEGVIRRGYEFYRSALRDCRTRLGLRYLQPGWFLCPGVHGEAPYLWFFPLSHRREHGSPATLAGLLQKRFEQYKRNARAEFFDTYFTNFNRQIVLVDVLSALHAGRAAFEDTERAIGEIAAHFRYGANWRIARPFQKIAGLGARIERVAFAATKADHVPALRRENLRNLLRSMAESMRPANIGQPVTYHVLASVMSTTDGTVKADGRPVEVVYGVPLGEERVRPYYPGDVPSGRPPDSFWTERFFELPVFVPPRIDPNGAMGIPHLGLDDIMVSLLKDVLR